MPTFWTLIFWIFWIILKDSSAQQLLRIGIIIYTHSSKKLVDYFNIDDLAPEQK